MSYEHHNFSFIILTSAGRKVAATIHVFCFHTPAFEFEIVYSCFRLAIIPSSRILDQLNAAVIDDRTENIRYRQNELQSLHAALRNNAGNIRSAISQDYDSDSKSISSEAESEFYLTFNAIAKFYKSLDFSEALKDEYLITHGSDNATRRVGKGLVVIRPTTHTRFYSIVCPIAAAIAAGNSMLLELGDTVMSIDSLLKELLPQVLDIDTFGISKQPILDPSVLDSAFLVD